MYFADKFIKSDRMKGCTFVSSGKYYLLRFYSTSGYMRADSCYDDMVGINDIVITL